MMRVATKELGHLTMTLLVCMGSAGCQSGRFADRLAGVGTLAGAGVGAIVGHQTGDAAAGAAIGAGVGALTGAAVGSSLDEQAAQNRAEIAAQIGRPPEPGFATLGEIVMMHQGGVSPDLIKGYIATSGVAGPPSADELIALHQQGVPTDVIRALQTAGTAPPQVVAPNDPLLLVEPETIYVEEPCPVVVGRPLPPPHWRHPRGRRVAWGVSVGL